MDEHPGAGHPDRPLAGLGRFAGKVALGTGLAVAAVVAVLRFMGPSEERPFRAPPGALQVPDGGRFAASGEAGTAPAGAGRTAAAPAGAAAGAGGTATAAVADSSASAAAGGGGAAGPIAREVERRLAAGELSDAQRRFEPCPGGDVRRTAWIDVQQRVRKLERLRFDGTRVEEWFDEAGALREALVRGAAPGERWLHRVVFDAGGAVSAEEGDGGPGGERLPDLVRSDPAGAFFGAAGCRR
jgi:hypothetical protein